MSLTWIQLMRAPSPRSGLMTTCESWAPAVTDLNQKVAVKRGCSVPPANSRRRSSPVSPARSVSDGEKT